MQSESLFGELKATVDELENDLSDQIARARAAANDPEGWKTFLLELLGKRPVLDPNSIHVRFALENPILQIANAYFGMRTVLRYYNVWHNFPTRLPARDSQLWHRDPGDLYMLKVFVHLSDVDEGAGPFIYAGGTHPKGRVRRRPGSIDPHDRVKRSDDSQMAKVVEPEKWIQGIGPKGTIIFADTRGYHKGGWAREHDRVMYVCMFNSKATKYPESFERARSISIPLDGEQAFALSQ